MAEKKPNDKLTIKEYQALKVQRNRKRFQFYPWQILAALAMPVSVFIFLLFYYVLHIRGMAG